MSAEAKSEEVLITPAPAPEPFAYLPGRVVIFTQEIIVISALTPQGGQDSPLLRRKGVVDDGRAAAICGR